LSESDESLHQEGSKEELLRTEFWNWG
jgi:hypothetical protein